MKNRFTYDSEDGIKIIESSSKDKIQKANTATSLSTSYKKGCLMLDVKFDDGVSEWAWNSSVIDRVSWEDVYDLPGYGKETEPHVTVLYGFELPTVTPDHIERLLPEGSVVFKISDVSVFEQEEYDVLKFGIESEQLHQLNSIYKVLPNSNSYPEYKPHLTISYLKKGRADKYIELFNRFVGKQFQSSKFDYSYNNADGLKAKAQWDMKGYESIEDDPADKILKSFDQGEISTAEYFDYLEKAKQYQIGQVSETTGLKKIAPGKWVDPNTGKAVKTDENGNVKKKPDVSSMSDEQLQEYAKNSSESELQEAIKNERNPKLREIANKELQRRENVEKSDTESKYSKEQVEYAKEFLKKISKKFSKDENFEPSDDEVEEFLNETQSKVEKQEEEKEAELTNEEIKVINDYTQTEYRKFNRQLRSGKVDADVMKKIESLSNSLKKLPDHKGTVHRGFSPIKELEEHLADFENNIGGEIEFPAFTSTSQSPKVIEDFGTVMSFEIVSKTGKDISHLSDFEEEQEILFDRGTKFKVKKVKKKVAKGKLMNFKVFLEEV